jgi:large subunit ribosomal protein L25
MEQKTLQGIYRKDLKKGITRALRREGKIPSIMYGHREPLAIAVNEHEFNTKFKIISENTIIKLTIEDNSYDVLVKDFQESILTGRISHIDFFEVEKGKLLKTNIPFIPNGTPMGVREGGLFEILIHNVEVECLPADIPEKIEMDVIQLNIGHSIHVKNLPQFPGVKYLNSPDQVVCVVTRKKEAKVTEEKPVEEAEEKAEAGEEAEATAEKE